MTSLTAGGRDFVYVMNKLSFCTLRRPGIGSNPPHGLILRSIEVILNSNDNCLAEAFPRALGMFEMVATERFQFSFNIESVFILLMYLPEYGNYG